MQDSTSDGSARNGSEKGFYALALPVELKSSGIQPSDLVFPNPKEVILAVKKFKAGRFKVFSNYEDALWFSGQWLTDEGPSRNSALSPDVEKSAFKAPAPKDLAAFRRSIESSDAATVKELIWSNPRYVVSASDTPVILMEGPRYNTAHVACKANRVDVLKILFEAISSTELMKALYPIDDDVTRGSRIQRIKDLYLNTPDKAACDTPLHYASKFGSVDCVALLLSSGCDTEKVNKQGMRASQVICQRKPNADLETQIESLFQSRYYVALIREDEEICKVAKPCTSLPHDEKVKALAGPMSPKMADELYKVLRSPVAANMEELYIRRTDSQKGVERIARSICRKSDIKWMEYWPFLNSVVNLATDEGLRLLEEHLRRVNRVLEENSQVPASPIEQEDLCERLSALKLTVEETLTEDYDMPEVFVTAPTSPDVPQSLYVDGHHLSMWDRHAALALMDHPIDEDKYPFVKKWFQRVISECPQSPLSPTSSFAPPLTGRRSTPLRNSISNYLQPRNIFE